MNISLLHTSEISKINSDYFYFGTNYKKVFKIKNSTSFQFLDYQKLFKKISKDEKFFFLKWIEKKRLQNKDSIFWWMNSIAGRNNLSSNLFTYLCQYFSIERHLKKNKNQSINIVCENYLLQKFLHDNLKKSYNCENNINLIIIFYENLYFFSNKYFRFLKEIFKFLIQILFAKITKPKNLYVPQKKIVLFHHCVNSYSKKIKKKSICNYFLDLPYLLKKKKNLEISSLFWTYSGYLNLDFYKSMRDHNSFVPQDWLNLGDYFKIFFHLKKIKECLKKKLEYKKNLNIDSLVNLEIKEQETTSAYKFLIYKPALMKWSQNLKELIIFDQYQNMTFEHVLRYVCKQLNIKTKTLGYHHSLMSEDFLGYQNLKKEWESSSRPDKVITIGKFAKRFLITGGIPRKKIIETFSLRQQKYKKNFKIKKNRNILLLLPLKNNLSFELCEKIKQINEKLNQMNFKIFIKTHPFQNNKELLNNLRWKKLPQNWIWAEKNLKKSLNRCYLVLTSSSAAVYDSILTGNIPIVVGSDLNLMDNYLDIFGEKEIKFNSSSLDYLPKFMDNLVKKKSIYHKKINNIQNKLINGVNSRTLINESQLVESIK